MKHKLIPKRIGALLLCLTLLAGLLPTAAWAADADKAIMLGASNISGYDSTNSYDYIYYGTWSNSPIKWRVLDDQTNFDSDSDGTNDAGLFLLSDGLLGTGNYGGVYFQQNYHYDSSSDTYYKGSSHTGDHTNCQIANAWQGSDAQAWCETFYSSNLTTQEQGAVLATTKSDREFTSSTYSFPFAASNDILNGDKVFFLSAEEAETSGYGFGNDDDRTANYGSSAGVWWLRSPLADYTNYAGAVYDFGNVLDYNVYRAWAARPAFNLNLNSVLFTSAAVGGKSSGAVGADALQPVSEYAGNEWKLTLLDDEHKDFEISNATINGDGDTIAFSYSGAQTGTNEYISVVIEDSGAITHYGRILQPGSASGTASFTLPAGVTLDNDTKLYVFNEQYNGDKMTDYASQLREIGSPTLDETASTLTAGTATRTGETTATVKFTSNEAGSYYYVVDSSETLSDSIDTSGEGTSCSANTETTITLDSLSGEYIHIVVKDAVNNVSNVLTIPIPAYTYTLTVNLNGGSGSATGGQYPAGEVVNIDAGSRSNYRFDGWTSSNGGTFADPSSPSTTFTMPAADTTITANWQYNPPYIPPVKTPSEQAIDKIEDAVDGVTVKITLSTGQTRLDKEVFEALAGRDVTLEISVPGGVSWTVNGQDIPKTANLTDLNLGVDLGTSGISVDVINAVTGEYGSVQITLAHDGEFGFALTLTAPLGRGNAGLWANLYHYDEARERLTFETSARIAADGSAALRMTHASQYAIVIDDRSHAMTFADVAEGAWYYDAVSYVYANGLMDGVSASEFAPDANMTRAMLVTILWRLEGGPVVNYLMPFADVDGGAWYAEAVRWAASEGIVEGVSATEFAPDAEITREQLAAILHRFAGEPATAANLATFTDAASVSAYAVDAMAWCVEQGIITGVTDDTLAPQSTATRAQCAAMLMRFAER